jgi:hypothetical protein
LNPLKNAMFTSAIFIQPDSELIRESVCACAKLFVDEKSTYIEYWELLILKKNSILTACLPLTKQ